MAELDWDAVSVKVRVRMSERGVTTAELARLTGLSETTIRQVRKGGGTGSHHEHMLVTLAAALGWHHQYLREVARGKVPEVPLIPLARIERKLDSLLARFEWLAAQVAELQEARISEMTEVPDESSKEGEAEA